MGRETSARQAQARALGWKEIKEFIGSAGEGIRADRERALLCVAYETLARRGELVALELRDIEFWPNGTGQADLGRPPVLRLYPIGGLFFLSPGTARFATKLIGEREVFRDQVTNSKSGSGWFGYSHSSVSTSTHDVTESAVLPSEIEQLPAFRAT